MLIEPHLSSYGNSTLTIVHPARILNTISWESVRRSAGRALSLSLIYIPSSLRSGCHGSKELDSNNATKGWSLWREEREPSVSVSGWDEVWTGSVWCVRCCTALCSCSHTYIITYIYLECSSHLCLFLLGECGVIRMCFSSGCIVQRQEGAEIRFLVFVNTWNELRLNFMLSDYLLTFSILSATLSKVEMHT